MDTDKLLAALAANAERALSRVPVTINGIGTLYVRPVTIEEFEKLEASAGSALSAGLARALCDEKGARLAPDVAKQFADALGKQPTDVMHALLSGVRGKGDDDGDKPGN
jgi:hypothetical protein